jgi:hypothetical protein
MATTPTHPTAPITAIDRIKMMGVLIREAILHPSVDSSLFVVGGKIEVERTSPRDQSGPHQPAQMSVPLYIATASRFGSECTAGTV